MVKNKIKNQKKRYNKNISRIKYNTNNKLERDNTEKYKEIVIKNTYDINTEKYVNYIS